MATVDWEDVRSDYTMMMSRITSAEIALFPRHNRKLLAYRHRGTHSSFIRIIIERIDLRLRDWIENRLRFVSETTRSHVIIIVLYIVITHQTCSADDTSGGRVWHNTILTRDDDDDDDNNTPRAMARKQYVPSSVRTFIAQYCTYYYYYYNTLIDRLMISV